MLWRDPILLGATCRPEFTWNEFALNGGQAKVLTEFWGEHHTMESVGNVTGTCEECLCGVGFNVGKGTKCGKGAMLWCVEESVCEARVTNHPQFTALLLNDK